MKISWKIIFVCIISLLLLNVDVSFAKENVELIVDRDNIIKEQEFKMNINITDANVAAFTVQIYFDTSKVEYVSGPDNANYVDSRIIYTWFDENGGNSLNQNLRTWRICI